MVTTDGANAERPLADQELPRAYRDAPEDMLRMPNLAQLQCAREMVPLPQSEPRSPRVAQYGRIGGRMYSDIVIRRLRQSLNQETSGARRPATKTI